MFAEQGSVVSKRNTRLGFIAEPASGEDAADDGYGFISGEEPFAYQSKMGRCANLHYHLLNPPGPATLDHER